MSEFSRDLTQRAADIVAGASAPAAIALWLSDIDVVLRICVSLGSLLLIGFAIAAKVRHWRRG
jgi:hypothetical protein